MTSASSMVAAVLVALLSNLFCQLHWVGSSQARSPFKNKCQVQPQVKMSVSTLYRPAASTDATSSLAKSIDFLETNYPGVRDLTHKFRTAGGFSDFNHTSMLAPRSNLHCLSLTPALCQLYIDYYPALALYCDPSLSVSIHQPSLSLSPPGGRKTARGGLEKEEQNGRGMISSWNCHWFCDMLIPSLFSVRRERGSKWSGFDRAALVFM